MLLTKGHALFTLAIAAVLAAVLTVAGCSSGSLMPSSSDSISLGEFANTDLRHRVRPDRATINRALVVAGLQPPPESSGPSVVEESLEEALDVQVRPGQTVIVDSLIGQVNGRPIFADEILAPLMAQLNAEFAKRPWGEFRMIVVQLVSQQIKSVLRNELFLAEARASMSEQEQMGFLAWMNNFRGEEIGRRGGVQSEANKQMLAQEGKTIDEFVKQQEEQALIQHLLSQRVHPNAVVAWRDVERAWEQREDEFNKKSTVTLGRIRLMTEGNEEQIKLIQAELDAGDPFNVVATAAGVPDGGVWETFELGSDGLSSIEIADFYKPHLENLGPGQTSSSFERGPRTLWISVIDIVRPEVHSLFDQDIQQSLYREIANRRYFEAENDFVDSLMKQGIYDDLAQMEEKLIDIALSRFLARR
ncbi:MAG: hypothetical protein MK095_08080 [Phycisphaerales bacterium]|nr:hypothetical protein [Phycisphaerales bacterium]